MEKLNLKIKRLEMSLFVVILINILLIVTAFRGTKSTNEKFDEIDVSRINVIDKNGVIKMVIASNDKIRQDSHDANVNKEEFKASGILFRNEEGEECGGLIYSGKKTKTGQVADASLTFDQYSQDQNVVLIHKENIDSLESSIDDGLIIIQRPDYKKIDEEYKTYDKLSKLNFAKEKVDSIRSEYANSDVISKRRLFIGTTRGLKDKKNFNETGLFIKSKSGNNKIGIYVDEVNIPHFEIYAADGKKIIYNLKLEKTK